MANTTALTATKNQGDQLTASEVNALDTGMVNALTRTGTTSLTGATAIDANGKTLTLDFTTNVASAGFVSMGDANFKFVQNGLGKLEVPADYTLLSGTGWPSLGSRTVYRTQRGTQTWNNNFNFDSGTKVYLCSVAAGAVYIPMTACVDGATLTGVDFYVSGGFGTAFVALPGTMPSVQVWKVDSGGTLSQLGGTISDTSANVGAFDVSHAISVTGLSYVIDNSAPTTISLQVTGPSGANFVASAFGLIGIRCRFTVTSLTAGG